MNFLAHFYLSKESDELMLGGFLGDFTKGEPLANVSAAVRAGILHHRLVDQFTDSHAIFGESKARFPQHLKRYAGILIDIYYDHFLAKNWAQLSGDSLNNFSERCISILDVHVLLLPKNALRFLSYMNSNGLPANYADLGMIDYVIHGISTYRLRRENPVLEGQELLREFYTEFERDFLRFFAALEQKNADLIRLAIERANA